RAGGLAVTAGVTDQAVAAATWDLVWAGRLTNDTLAPLRTVLGTGRPVADAAATNGHGGPTADGPPAVGRPGRYGRPGARRPGLGRAALPSRNGPPTVSGRWSLLLAPVERDEAGRTRRLHALAGALLDRHGILIRGAVAAERVAGGFGALYPVLRAMEEAGQCRRGYFVEGLGAAQFALPGAVDRMRAMADAEGGALVVLADGQLVLYVERGGKTLLSWTSDPALLDPAAAALAGAVREGALGR